MLDHLFSVHGGDRFICSICYMKNRKKGVWFTTKYSLLRHCRRVKHDIPDIVQVIPVAEFQADEDYTEAAKDEKRETPQKKKPKKK